MMMMMMISLNYELTTAQVYIGQYARDMRHGVGTLSTRSGLYVGIWDRNAYSHVGVCVHLNGDVYEGEFQRSKYNGKGQYVTSAGYARDKIWVDDVETDLPCNMTKIHPLIIKGMCGMVWYGMVWYGMEYASSLTCLDMFSYSLTPISLM